MKYLILTLVFYCSSSIYCQDDFAMSYGKLYPYEYLIESKLTDLDSFSNASQIETIQKSVVRMNNSFSGVFVSSDGLLITVNHAIRTGYFEEDILRNGFRTNNKSNEIKVKNFEIQQLLNYSNVTDDYNQLINKYGDKKIAIDQIKYSFRQKKGWSLLKLEIKEVFNSNQVILYGYKIYNDIRLVFLPPADYSSGVIDRNEIMDFLFFRIYENNSPINSSSFHLEIDLQGNNLNQKSYIVGYPQKTTRHKTANELLFIKDYQVETKLEKARVGLTRRGGENDAFKIKFETEDVRTRNEIAVLKRQIEEYENHISGMKQGEVIGFLNRRKHFINAHSEASKNLFSELAQYLEELETIEPLIQKFSGSRGIWLYTFLERLNEYRESIGIIKDAAILKGMLQHAYSAAPNLKSLHEQSAFKKAIIDLKDNRIFTSSHTTLLQNFDSEDEFVDSSFTTTEFINFESAMKLLNDHDRMKNLNDPMLRIAEQIIPLVEKHSLSRILLYEKIDSVNNLITKEVLKIADNKLLSPDANGSLRISPGKIMNYNEKGIDEMRPTTLEEIMSKQDTSSIDGETYVNFIENHGNKICFIASDTDGTKGSSGSPLLNDSGKIMGLVIKSGSNTIYPKDFIFDSKARAVSIHIQMIYLILKDLFQENKICQEMIKNK